MFSFFEARAENLPLKTFTTGPLNQSWFSALKESFLPNYKPVLIVEDNDDDVFMLQHAFQKAGIPNPVHIVRTGKEAIAFLAGMEPYSNWNMFPLPTIVLLDLNLPDLSGLEVLRWIRNTSGLQALRVAIFTGSCCSKDLEMAYELGANGFATKPISLVELVEIVKNFRAHWLEHSMAPEVSRPRQQA